MKNMGGMASLMGKLPGMGQIPDNVKSQMDDKVLVRMEAIINSMTMKERAKPEIIKGSRKRRIAAGCGMQVQDVNRLLKQFDDMQRMMKKMKKGGMAKMMRSMKGMMPQASWSLIGLACLPFWHRDVLVILTYCVYAPVTAHSGTKLAAPPTAFTAELATVDCNSRKMSKIFGLLI